MIFPYILLFDPGLCPGELRTIVHTTINLVVCFYENIEKRQLWVRLMDG